MAFLCARSCKQSVSYFQNATMSCLISTAAIASFVITPFRIERAIIVTRRRVGYTRRPSVICQLTTVRVLNVVFISAPIKLVAVGKKKTESNAVGN